MKLSIIIPAFNVEKTIMGCIMSIINQKISDFEIIVVDDGSVDQTLLICKKLANEYAPMKVITQENSGVSVARNNGIQHACGEWVIFVDGDDALQPGTLRRIDFDVEEDFLVFGYRKELLSEPWEKNYAVVHESTKILQKVVLNKAGYPDYLREVKVLDSTSCWTCWGKAFRRDMLLKNHIEFPQGITHGEDLVFIYRYCAVANSVIFLDFPVYYYRITNNSVAHRFNPKRLENTAALIRTLENEPGVKGSEDFDYFVFDRLYTCCRLFFGKDNVELTKTQKTKLLSELCQKDCYKQSLSISSIYNLSAGKITRLKKWYVLQLLKKKKYERVIGLFNDSFLNHIFA